MLGWWGRRERASHLLVTVYSRGGCHACHEAVRVLSRYQRRHRFRMDVVDVDSDPQLITQHGEWVPVVLVDGKVRSRGPMNRILLERLFNAEARMR